MSIGNLDPLVQGGITVILVLFVLVFGAMALCCKGNGEVDQTPTTTGEKKQ